MSFWTKLLQGAGKAAKGVGSATKATGKAVGGSVLHPQQTLRGAGTAMKTAAVGSAAGYVAWEKIVNDIRTVCLSDNKMTEKERMEIVFGIRPKLKQMNKKLQRLTKAVKYTTMTDVWNEIDEGARPKPTSKKEIAEAAKRRWKHCGKTVGYPTSHRGKGFDFFEE